MDVKIRAKILALIAAVSACAYHIVAIFGFLHFNVIPMVFFNIGSIILFALTAFLVVIWRPTFWMYALCFCEVVVHQTLAEYYVGFQTGFHYFILMLGLLPFLIFYDKPVQSFLLGIFACIAFTIVEAVGYSFVPVHTLSRRAIFIVQAINVGVFSLVMLGVVSLFTLFIGYVEGTYIFEIDAQAHKIQSQNEKVIAMQNNTIISMANLVENRDVDTGGHIKRTSGYVRILAEKAAETPEYKGVLTPYYVEMIGHAAPMHDIGKIVVPDAILKKPGKLTPDEFLQIQRHTVEGARIVHEVFDNNSNPDYVKIASEIALCHHEKWNGSGYPQQLAGNDIPVCARIMALSDVFDALVSVRCYKKPFSLDEAFKVIEDSSGSHFDPVLVECFLNARYEIEELAAEN